MKTMSENQRSQNRLTVSDPVLTPHAENVFNRSNFNVNSLVPTSQNCDNVCENQNVSVNQKCNTSYNTSNVSCSANQQRKPPRHYRTPCFRCGKCDHFPSQCRSITRKCRKCKKIGHIAIMCRSKIHVSKPRSKTTIC